MPSVIYKAYYTESGAVSTYTTEDIPGDWIEITAEQFAEARYDAYVHNGKLITPNKTKIVTKLVRNVGGAYKTSKYDINILTDVETAEWSLVHNVVKW